MATEYIALLALPKASSQLYSCQLLVLNSSSKHESAHGYPATATTTTTTTTTKADDNSPTVLPTCRGALGVGLEGVVVAPQGHVTLPYFLAMQDLRAGGIVDVRAPGVLPGCSRRALKVIV